jgi:hypothetical protein
MHQILWQVYKVCLQWFQGACVTSYSIIQVILGILCLQRLDYTIDDITSSYVLSLNLMIKRLHKRWNWHVKSVVNAGTVLVLDLTLGALISCDVLVLTWIKGT